MIRAQLAAVIMSLRPRGRLYRCHLPRGKQSQLRCWTAMDAVSVKGCPLGWHRGNALHLSHPLRAEDSSAAEKQHVFMQLRLRLQHLLRQACLQ